jgi:FkbM family methyltransferase
MATSPTFSPGRDEARYRIQKRPAEDTVSTHPGRLTRDHVIWAYRLLLDRDPESEDVIGPKLAGSRDTADLRRHLMTSAEFKDKNRDYAHTNDRTVVIKELAPGLRLFVDLADHVIGLNIVRGGYEADEVAFVRRVLELGDVAIDAGAHIGFFTMHMAACVGPAGRVHAFEPMDANAELLERSIAENGFADRVELRRAAVGRTSGTATLTFPNETLNTGGAYLLRDGTSPLGGNRVRDVAQFALDDPSLGLRRPVRLLKLDVEGAEPQVIEGAARLLAQDRPFILSELHPTQLDRASASSPAQFLKQMHALGYRGHRLSGASIGPVLEHPRSDEIATIVFIPN